ncbi:MAG: hypothetical protein NVS2B8_04980 [Vulcanimicrobiaceae bacterium]
MRAAAMLCRGCDLYAHATQTVFGVGPTDARLVLVGEQPGDAEDRAGEPFVGPAGKLLDRALERAGIARSDAYVTNAVKHFKFVERGKRRIHQSPKVTEMRACAPWLEAEIETLQPELVVALGATASKTIFGTDFRLTDGRGVIYDRTPLPRALATIHPSAILRALDDASRDTAFENLVADLRVAAAAL